MVNGEWKYLIKLNSMATPPPPLPHSRERMKNLMMFTACF